VKAVTRNIRKKITTMKTLIISILVIMPLIVSCQNNPSDNQAQETKKAPASDDCNPSINNIITYKEDISIFEDVVLTFENMGYDNTPLPEIVVAIGNHLKGTPYVASTLEAEGEEQLVINLQGMDCTTFVEYVLALSFSVKTKKTSFGDFADHIACLRYRNGIINGYTSRLHYFTDWLHDNSEKGFVSVINDLPGSIPLDLDLNFMSRNPHLYKQLTSDALVDSMKRTESRLKEVGFYYLSKNSIQNAEDKILDGDIIAFVTSIEGLDVSHTGFAIQQNGRLHLLHASTRTNLVEITPTPLDEYLLPLDKVKGILVARVNDNDK
jgi:hypothetical protein